MLHLSKPVHHADNCAIKPTELSVLSDRVLRQSDGLIAQQRGKKSMGTRDFFQRLPGLQIATVSRINDRSENEWLVYCTA
jgi:hypothetical protein